MEFRDLYLKDLKSPEIPKIIFEESRLSMAKALMRISSSSGEEYHWAQAKEALAKWEKVK